ncbi:MAG TPA: hypothetical protein VFJ58_04095 [Armatimonadota bacterium]|nr:hypothetical protein [Armatimonadota bacterium]
MVEVQDLRVDYDLFCAVRDVNLNIRCASRPRRQARMRRRRQDPALAKTGPRILNGPASQSDAAYCGMSRAIGAYAARYDLPDNWIRANREEMEAP